MNQLVYWVAWLLGAVVGGSLAYWWTERRSCLVLKKMRAMVDGSMAQLDSEIKAQRECDMVQFVEIVTDVLMNVDDIGTITVEDSDEGYAIVARGHELEVLYRQKFDNLEDAKSRLREIKEELIGYED